MRSIQIVRDRPGFCVSPVIFLIPLLGFLSYSRTQ